MSICFILLAVATCEIAPWQEIKTLEFEVIFSNSIKFKFSYKFTFKSISEGFILLILSGNLKPVVMTNLPSYFLRIFFIKLMSSISVPILINFLYNH